MGNLFSVSCDPCINKAFHLLEEKVASIHQLEKKLGDLEKAIRVLKAKRDDLQRKVTREEDRGRQRLAEIEVWFIDVEGIEKEFDDILRSRDDQLQRLCLCGFCSKSLRSSYRYGKRVILTLGEVEKLQSRVFEEVTEVPITSQVQERQIQPLIVGQETMIDEAWKLMREDEVAMMGFYGMGGVGKTTLITQLNNKFSKEMSGFDFIVWVVVSKELNVGKIQDEIARKVGIRDEEWKQKEQSEKVDVIYNFLRQKRFVLFLDDLWEKVDLVDIGIPFPTAENRCKLVLTSRSKDVCTHMGVEEPMEVKCMENDVAFDLFQRKVGKRTLESHPEIPDLAKIIAGKCHGLPLALNVIGETMACKGSIQEWHHAIHVLNEYSREFSGMKEKVLPLLKYSYDNLKEEELKSCLVYCSLFPEDCKIVKDTLIDYWISEGMIDGRSESIEQLKNKGYEIIRSLVSASLLMECVDGFDRKFVYLHDVVREMALWIASGLGKQKEAFVVRAGVGLCEMPKVGNWSAVRRMSLMSNKIRHLCGSPECVELKTLLLQHINLENISSDFFNSMPKLGVLDLSRNESLSEVPDGISELDSLQYLNLSGTSIQHLPLRGRELKTLIHLDLHRTHKLLSLDGISNVHNLKVLKLHDSSVLWDLKTVEELDTLQNLEVLTLKIEKETAALELYLKSHRLASCTRQLEIRDIDMGSSGCISLPVTMEKLRDLTIRTCRISEIKMVYNPRNPCFLSLSSVKIIGCKLLRDLTFLMFAPNLKRFQVVDAPKLESIINKEKACEGGESEIIPFPKLTSFELISLPELKSIYWRPLSFPCLKKISVHRCLNLKKLPLDSQSGTHGEDELIIRYGKKEWIEGIEWEDEATKTRFSSSCKQW